MCPNCRAFITTDDKVCPYCEIKLGPKAVEQRNPGDILGGLIPHARFTTVVILLINAGLYIATGLFSMQSGHGGFGDLDSQTLVLFGAKYVPFIVAGQWWRLITAGFLHGGLMHIGMNSWVLFDLGAQVEEVYGTARYLVFYFVATVVGFAASMLWSPAISVGASAALLGLVGAMIALGVRSRSSYGSAIRRVYMRYVVYILIFGLLPIFSVDNAAHIGGLAGGFATAYLAGTPRYSGLAERIWKYAALICVAMTVYAFLQMFLFLTRVTHSG